MPAEVTVVRRMGAWMPWCTIHGPCTPWLYADPTWAAWTALGHAAAHHPPVAVPSERPSNTPENGATP